MIEADYNDQAVWWRSPNAQSEVLLLAADEHFGNPALWVGPVLLETAEVLQLVKLMQGWLRTGIISEEFTKRP